MDIYEYDAYDEDVSGRLRTGHALHGRDKGADGHSEKGEHVADCDCWICSRLVYTCV